MSYTLAEAARAVGKNKSTILRAIVNGRISGTRDDLGQWHIEAVELHRIFPPVASAAESADAAHQYAAPDAAVIAEANARVSLAEQRLSELKVMLDDMRQDRDRWVAESVAWRSQAEASQRLLTDQRERQAVGWWRWLRSTG
jgi:hypothetical protein